MIVTFDVRSQELLINGDFEDSRNCPNQPLDFELCKDWYILNETSPDYFKNCSDTFSAFGTPLNFMGKQEPHSGNAYVGLIAIDLRDFSYREYITGTLNKSLIKDSIYKISLYLNWADYSVVAFDELGFLFTDEDYFLKIQEEKTDILNNSDGYFPLSVNDLKDKSSWQYAQTEFKAKGGEKHIVIGIFADQFNKREYRIKNRQIKSEEELTSKKYVYFYIDDVSITSVTSSNKNRTHY